MRRVLARIIDNRKDLARYLLFTVMLYSGCCGSSFLDNACRQTLDMRESAIRKISYYFRDAPIPPTYHRSYAITVTLNRVKIVVDSYGDILAEKEYQIRNSQFKDVIHSLKRNRIRNSTLGVDEGCTGGTCEKISYADGEKEIFSGTVCHCGGEDTGDLAGDVKSFADDVRKLVPHLEELLQ